MVAPGLALILHDGQVLLVGARLVKRCKNGKCKMAVHTYLKPGALPLVVAPGLALKLLCGQILLVGAGLVVEGKE